MILSVSRDSSPPPQRKTYRHGDLRRALIDAAIELARSGGPSAVVLREATRRAGVVPNAAYRHFANRDELLYTVRAESLGALARAMETQIAALGPERPDAEYARAMMHACGSGYIQFALEEAGLFRTAFLVPSNVTAEPDPAMTGSQGLTAFEMLGAALDRMVAAGVLAAERRPGADYVAWSSVHGLAMLLIQGPLSALPREQTNAVTKRLFEMVDKGL